MLQIKLRIRTVAAAVTVTTLRAVRVDSIVKCINWIMRSICSVNSAPDRVARSRETFSLLNLLNFLDARTQENEPHKPSFYYFIYKHASLQPDHPLPYPPQIRPQNAAHQPQLVVFFFIFFFLINYPGSFNSWFSFQTQTVLGIQSKLFECTQAECK